MLVANPDPCCRQKKTFTFSDMVAAVRSSHFSMVISYEASDISKLGKMNKPRYQRGFKHSEIVKL